MGYRFSKIEGKSISYGNMKSGRNEFMYSCGFYQIPVLVIELVSSGISLVFYKYLSSDNIRGDPACSE